jgi:hypothetical protein
MGAAYSLASRAKRGAKAYVLRPFKRRGYFLTRAEYKERHPSYYDKVDSDAYMFEPEALMRLKLNHKDHFRRLRQKLLASVEDDVARARYLERYAARVARANARKNHASPARARFDPAGASRANAGFVPGARTASLDALPPGAVPDAREVALGRFDPSDDRCSRRESHRPSDDDDDAFFHRRRRRSWGGHFDSPRPPPPSVSDAVGTAVPARLAFQRLEPSGACAEYDTSEGVSRWREYVDEEEGKIRDFVAADVAKRRAKDSMMRRHYRRTYGMFGRAYEPPPLPRWMRDAEGLHENAPWRRGRRAAANVREAVEGFDETLKRRTLEWWGAVDLRQSAAEREARALRAANEAFGEASGAEVVRSGAGFFLGGAKPGGHAGGIDASLKDRWSEETKRVPPGSSRTPSGATETRTGRPGCTARRSRRRGRRSGTRPRRRRSASPGRRGRGRRRSARRRERRQRPGEGGDGSDGDFFLLGGGGAHRQGDEGEGGGGAPGEESGGQGRGREVY